MRLAHFQLQRYGPFQQLDLPLDPTPGRLNLIVAPNGFGKSVIRRAIGDFLFGIDARTPMSFRFGTERMQLRADVIHDGHARSLVRRKGNGVTLAQADGTDVRPDEARQLFGTADLTIFRELFGLDTSLLRSGGQDLIRSQGRLGQVLFAAGGGMARVRDLLTELEHKRDELGKATARHKSRPIWSALTNWEQSSAELRRVAMRPDNWLTLEQAAQETATVLETLTRQQAEDALVRERLRTIGACRPWLDRLRAAETILANAQDVPNLDDTFEKQWRDALQHRVVSAGNAQAATAHLQTAREARAKLSFNPAWIAAAADIEALPDIRGRAQGAEADLPTVERERTIEQAKVAMLRHDLGWDAAVQLPPAPVVKDAQRRLQRHLKLQVDADAANDVLEATDRALAAASVELTALPNQSDVAAIADLVALLRAGGDPANRLDLGRRKLRDAETAFSTALAAIPDCPIPEAVLASTAAPSETKLEAVGNALTQAEAEHGQAVRDYTTKTATIDTAQTKLVALQQRAMLPPPDALAQARSRRDTLWHQFCAASPERPDPQAAVALDRAIRDADTVADALLMHGQEVAEANALRAHLETLQAERAKQADAVNHAAVSLKHARDALLTLAQAAGGNADNLSGLHSFLRARHAAVACRTARDAAAADLQDIEQDLLTLTVRLASAMQVVPPNLAEVGTLLAQADRRINQDIDLTAQRKSLTVQIAKQRIVQAAAALKAGNATRALTDWHAEWRNMATALARPEAEAPATAIDAVAQIEDLRKAEAAVIEKQARIDNMHAAIALLAQKVSRLSELAPELTMLPPVEAANLIYQRLQAEHREAARCTDANRQIEQAEAKQAVALAEAAAAARTLDGLRAALQVDSEEDAERQLQRSRAAATARADCAEAVRQLAVQSGGLGIPTLSARAAETTADADVARIRELDASDQQRALLIDAARDAKTAAAAALDQAGTGMQAAHAAQQREAAQAMLARSAEEALILHAAHALLQTALDRQAKNADQPLLTRIGEVFRTITGGTQAGVRVQDTKDGQTMMALEADGVTRKPLDQLSEGTTDQLYLALRIAALEDYAATAPPLPFIADDILQTFDDPRTIATLHALLALSDRVQVIVLTHHPHVGALAAAALNGAVQVTSLRD